MRGLSGKGAIVTGGVQGIGHASVLRLRAEGARVAVIDRDADGCAALRAALPDVIALTADVTDLDAIEAAFAEVIAAFGRLDVVFNNAGISAPGDSLTLPAEHWRRTLAVNVDGVFHCARTAARHMKAQGSGVIINMASVSGMVAIPDYLAYNTSKAAVIQLTRTLALELAPIVRVNSISPGYVLTPMQEAEYTPEQMKALNARIPMGRHADPAEIAALVAFLASEEAPFMTGSNVVIDGGETAGGTASR
ncbi:MAG: SDR family oxidoreductase [bacterium]